MSMQLCYRTKEGATFYSQPTYAGDGTISFDQGVPANGVIFAVVVNSDYIYEGESTRTAKFDYKLKLGEGAVRTADVNKNWFDWRATITDNLATTDFSSKTSKFVVYPNPSTNASSIRIKLLETNPSEFDLKILNINGQVIYKKDKCNSEEQFSSSKLSKGIYFITVKSDSFQETKKIIVQ